MTKNDKFRTTIWISKSIWDTAGSVLNSRNAFIEDQLKRAIGASDEEDKIIKHIESKKQELDVLKNKLCDLRNAKKQRKLNLGVDDDRLQNAIKVLTRMYEVANVIGENQIKDISDKWDIDYYLLLRKLTELKLSIVKFYAHPVETRTKNRF